MKRLVIIDGNSLINRAYYAIQKPMVTSEGIYTQGIYGFLNMLAKIRKDYEPSHMLVAFDKKAPTFRHKEYAQYKAGRRKMPLELAMELEPLKQILHAMGIKTYEEEGWEADDIIGTTATLAEKEGLESYIVTGDRDALQLATELTKVIINLRGVTDFKLYDDAAMVSEYGFDHHQFIDYKGLRGDTSDNIPGIAGIGEVTATKLILQFGSIENMLAHTDEIQNAKLREKVENGAMDAVMSKRLATIITNVPVSYTISDLEIQAADIKELSAIYRKLEFRKFLEALGDCTESIDCSEETIADYPVIYDNTQLLDNAKGSYAIDIVTNKDHTNLPTIEELRICKGGKVYIANFISPIFLMQIFGTSAEKSSLRATNLSEIFYVLLSYGIDISNIVPGFDLGIAEYVLNPGRANYDQLDFSNPGRAFAMLDSMQQKLENKIETEGLYKLYSEIELPLTKVLATMEFNGIKLDKSALKAVGMEYREKLSSLEKEIYILAGTEFNINSPKQLGTVLFETLNMPHGKKTKTGYSTNADVLEKLAEDYPIADLILQYRAISKLNGTYVEGMLPLLDGNDMVHPHFQQTVTATGRLSCTEPNLQNIPVREEEGRKLRKLFTVNNPDSVLISADYSQIELRVLAHLSGDKELIDAFNSGHDIHKETASKVFGIPLDQVTPELRSKAKAVNFGVIYGMSSFGLSGRLTITRKEAESYINDYFARFTTVKAYLDKCVADCKLNGYATTMFGRKRYIPEINASNFMQRQLGERLAMNTPIQGSAADIIKIAMNKVYNRLNEECPRAKLILQIHDELVIHAPKECEEQVKNILTDCMENAAKLAVKLQVSPASGTDWYQLK